jgi:hypothetical protein
LAACCRHSCQLAADGLPTGGELYAQCYPRITGRCQSLTIPPGQSCQNHVRTKTAMPIFWIDNRLSRRSLKA